MGEHDPFDVSCPVCHSQLTIDPDDGEVLMHKTSGKKDVANMDIVQAAQDLKKDASHREDLFNKSFEAEKNKSDRLRKTFDEAFKKARENPDEPLPPREIDLD